MANVDESMRYEVTVEANGRTEINPIKYEGEADNIFPYDIQGYNSALQYAYKLWVEELCD